jgi:hypothetical protein
MGALNEQCCVSPSNNIATDILLALVPSRYTSYISFQKLKKLVC